MTCGTLSAMFPTFYVAEPPKVMSHPISQKDVCPGKVVTFSVQVIGTQPLKYQWQWKPFGEEGKQDRWQNLSNEVGTKLKLTEVKVSSAGYYQCVVSNSAGNAPSQHASLTVGMFTVVIIMSTTVHQ